MKFKILLSLIALACTGLVLAQSPDQQEEENVRGAFLTSRPKERPPQSSTAERPTRRRPRTTPTNSGAKSTPTPGPTADVSMSAEAGNTKVSAGAKMGVQRMGLGLTLFTRDPNGLAIRVDPSHEFHKGEKVRVLLETNADGYLYIFNTTDNGPPVMIYPNAELDQGGNYLRAHVPFEIPSSASLEERLKWFTFDQYAGTERLYFVFTRQPLPNVPIEDDLIAYCRANEKACPWRPGPELWTQLQREMNAPLKTDKSQKYGRAQTAMEKDSTTRGIGLSQEDPEPSVILMAVATGTNSLVTALDLVHR